jgi:hypothetical protein
MSIDQIQPFRGRRTSAELQATESDARAAFDEMVLAQTAPAAEFIARQLEWEILHARSARLDNA